MLRINPLGRLHNDPLAETPLEGIEPFTRLVVQDLRDPRVDANHDRTTTVQSFRRAFHFAKEFKGDRERGLGMPPPVAVMARFREQLCQ